MSEEAAGSDDFSGLGGFFFYMFLVHPITAWILRPGRFEKKKSIMYAIAFLAALAAIKTGESNSGGEPNSTAIFQPRIWRRKTSNTTGFFWTSWSGKPLSSIVSRNGFSKFPSTLLKGYFVREFLSSCQTKMCFCFDKHSTWHFFE